MTAPTQPESRLLRAKRRLASEPFSPCYFMGVPLDEFTAPEIAKVAQIAMNCADDEYCFSKAEDFFGNFGPPVNPFKKGDTAVVVSKDSIFEGKIIKVEAVVNDRVVATWGSSRELGSLYQISFDYKSLCQARDSVDDNIILSEN